MFYHSSSRLSKPLYTDLFKKYAGGKEIIRLRSRTERYFLFEYLEKGNRVLEWDYECCRIPYKNPITNIVQKYVPDFVVKLKDKDSARTFTMVVEIKPLEHIFPVILNDTIVLTEQQKEMYKKTLDIAKINIAKFKAADNWALENGYMFLVFTGNDFFAFENI